MKDLTIPFASDISLGNERLLYVGQKSRYSTMTSVILLDEGLLAAANYYMRQVYIVEFDLDTGTFTELDRMSTCGDADALVPGPTDLMDQRLLADGQRQLLLSNFEQCSFTIYDLQEDHSIRHNSTVVSEQLGWCHGISALPGDDHLVVFATSGTTNPNAGIYALRPDQPGRLLLSIQDPEWKPKDICFDGGGVMYAVYCNGAPKSQSRPRYSTRVARFEVDMASGNYRRTAELVVEQLHVDACRFHRNKLYVAGESMLPGSRGGIYVFDVADPGSITLEGIVGDFSFPHGVDIRFGLMAVASYGSSDITITPFDPAVAVAPLPTAAGL